MSDKFQGPTEFRWLQYTDGRTIECCDCGEPGAVNEFYGFCPNCWRRLEPAERAVLRGEEPPVEKVVHHTTMLPSWTIAQWFYNLAIGAAVAWLYWILRK